MFVRESNLRPPIGWPESVFRGLLRLAVVAFLASSALAEQPPRDPPTEATLPAGAVARFGTMFLRAVRPMESVGWLEDDSGIAGLDQAQTAYTFEFASMRMALKRLSPRETVLRATLSSSGRMAASVDALGRVSVWDMKGLKPRDPSPAFRADAVCLCFSRDDRSLVCGYADGSVLETALEPGSATVEKLKCRGKAVAALRCARAAGRTLVSLEGGAILLAGETWTLSLPATPSAIDLSPDGSFVAFAAMDGPARVLTLDGSAPEVLMGDDSSQFRFAAFSPDAATLVTGDASGRLALWNSRTGKRLALADAHSGAVRGAAWSRDGKRIGSCGDDRRIRLWDAGTLGDVDPSPGHADAVTAVAISADEKRFASGSADGVVMIREVDGGKRVSEARDLGDRVASVRFLADGKVVAAAGTSVYVFQDVSLAARTVLSSAPGAVRCLEASKDGKFLYAGSTDGWVRGWSMNDLKEPPRLLKENRDVVTSLAISPDGDLLATTSTDGLCRVWKASDFTRSWGVEVWRGPALSTAFSPDGKLVASGSAGSVVFVCEAKTGAVVSKLAGFEGGATSLAWSPDGRFLAACNPGNAVRVVSASTGKEIAWFRSSGGPMNAVAWFADSARLVSGSWDTSVTLWQLPK